MGQNLRGRKGLRMCFVTLFVSFAISTSLTLTLAANGDNSATTTSILEDLQLYNASCSLKNSCKIDKVSRISDDPEWNTRNCLCDDLCAKFGDCCPDSRRFNPEEQVAAADRFECIELRQYKSNLMVTKCPANWSEIETKLLCEAENQEAAMNSDPVSFMPVTNKKNGITYRNIHCAVCNGDVPATSARGESFLRFWTPRLECHSIMLQNNAVQRLPKNVLATKVEWSEKENAWGIVMDLDGRGPKFHGCQVDPYLPDDLQTLLRPCRQSIRQCAINWTDKAVSDKCRSYTSLLYSSETWSSSSEPFRNVHCALCNYADPSTLKCDEMKINFRDIPLNRDFSPASFALLFDLNNADGSGIVGQQKNCKDGQLYDPFARKCRQVFCSGEGQTYREGRCVESTVTSTTTTTTTSTTASTSTTSSTTTTSTTTTPSTTTVSSTTTQGTTSEINDIVVFPDDSNTSTSSPSSIQTTEVTTKATTSQTETTTTSTTTTEATKPSTTTATSTTVLPVNKTEDSKINNQFLSCPKFKLSFDEVQWRENDTLYIPAYDKEFGVGEYKKLEDDGIVICAEGVTTVAKFSSILGWVTLCGLGLSEICLALHLMVFMFTPEVRNLSGCNLVSLSAALFSAYGSFIASQFIPTGSSICVIVAVSTYYFFLAAFWWTSVLAWDVWRTLRLATIQLRAPSGKQRGKFALYSLYAWLVPALVVVGTLVIEYVDIDIPPWVPTHYHPHFGQHVCWFGQRQALLVYFAAPLAAILAVNIILFIWSAYMIRSTTANSPACCNAAGSRKQLGLYVRLALLMGLSWTAGLIAGIADFEPMWYVFAALCTLQGLFILLSYPKVLRSLKTGDFWSRRRVTYRTTLATKSKGDQLRRLGLEARDSHDSQASNTSQTSQTSLTKTSSGASP